MLAALLVVAVATLASTSPTSQTTPIRVTHSTPTTSTPFTTPTTTSPSSTTTTSTPTTSPSSTTTTSTPSPSTAPTRPSSDSTPSHFSNSRDSEEQQSDEISSRELDEEFDFKEYATEALGYLTYYKGSLFRVYYDTKSWEGAWEQCYNDHAHLAIPDSEKEANVIRSLYEDVPERDPETMFAYIGVHSLFKRNLWVTLDNKPVNKTGYYKWSPRHHSSTTDGRCAALHALGGYLSIPCEEEHIFVCEME